MKHTGCSVMYVQLLFYTQYESTGHLAALTLFMTYIMIIMTNIFFLLLRFVSVLFLYSDFILYFFFSSVESVSDSANHYSSGQGVQMRSNPRICCLLGK